MQRLQEKLALAQDSTFYLFKVLRAHILPLTNVAFNKSGSRLVFIVNKVLRVMFKVLTIISRWSFIGTTFNLSYKECLKKHLLMKYQ